MAKGPNKYVQIDKAYSGIPPVPCKPGCTDCCGPIMMSRLEWDRIAERIGKDPEGRHEDFLAFNRDTGSCSLLVDNQCSVYDIRPMICRLYATGTSRMQCPHGCVSERPLSENSCSMLLQKSMRVGK